MPVYVINAAFPSKQCSLIKTQHIRYGMLRLLGSNCFAPESVGAGWEIVIPVSVTYTDSAACFLCKMVHSLLRLRAVSPVGVVALLM